MLKESEPVAEKAKAKDVLGPDASTEEAAEVQENKESAKETKE